MDLLTTVLHEMGHALGFGDQAALRLGSEQAQRHATLMTETLPTGVRRIIQPDLPPAGPIMPRAVQEHLTPGDGWIERLLGRSLRPFTGAWGLTTNGPSAGLTQRSESTTKPAPSMIDWTEDEPRDQKTQTAIGASGAKTSWLSRFLLETGRPAAQPHEHEIEIALRGKKK